MAGLKDKVLFRLIHDFLKIYLPGQKCSSPHTIKNYRISVDMLLNFIKQERNITLADITFEMLDANAIVSFLDWLENERGCGVSTRNQRLKCLHSFFNYAATIEPMAVLHQVEIRKIALKKEPEKGIVDFMSEAAVRALLEAPDTSTKKGFRDLCYMALSYDTAARVQEMLNLKICDLTFGRTATALLHGKGSKVRTVPLMEKTVSLLKRYIDIFHPGGNTFSDEFLFYIERQNERKQMSDDNVRKFMRNYSRKAHGTCDEVPEEIHPHLWRHSRAMHLYQRGMDLTLISQWLGHVNLETTLIYAHADTELKRRAIEQAMTVGEPIFKNDTAHFQVNDEELLKKLYGLK